MADTTETLYPGVNRKLYDNADGTYSENIPFAIFTNGGNTETRLCVDDGQTGFFLGNFFRTYKEFVIPTAGPALSFRFISAVNFILWLQRLEITQGALRAEIFPSVGVTPSGTWTSNPVIGMNRSTERPTPYYESQVTVETGGSFTGGTATDLMLIRSASQNVAATNVIGSGTVRFLPAGTYYGRLSTLTGGLSVTDDAQGVYSLEWEERPAQI